MLLAFTSSALCGQLYTSDVATRALGGTGLAREGGEAVWTNPAGIAHTTAPAARATVEQRFGLAELQLASLAASFPGGLGVRLSHYGYAGFSSTLVDGLYARRLTDRIALGIALGVHRIRPPQHEPQHTLRTGIGLQYRLSERVRAGAVWRRDRTDLTENSYACGVSYRPSELIDLSAELHFAAELGLHGRFGISYQPVDVVVLRWGLNTASSELSGGIGYRLFQRWEVAVAVAYHEQLGISPLAGLILRPD